MTRAYRGIIKLAADGITTVKFTFIRSPVDRQFQFYNDTRRANNWTTSFHA